MSIYYTNMDFIENSKNGLVYMTAPCISARHAFTTRMGGASTGTLASLNLGTARGDEPENVRENYRRLALATGIDTLRMAFTRQVHGNRVQRVGIEDIHELFTPVAYEADGIVTNERGLALICFTADCVPVLLCDERAGVIAAVHCGWRSSVADILGNAVAQMRELGARPESICAGIGPAISRCCFEVGGEVIEQVEKYLGGDCRGLWQPEPGVEGRFMLDLKGANARRLTQLGLRRENIAISGECTKCSHEKYWSHRYTGGSRGSQGALIVLD